MKFVPQSDILGPGAAYDKTYPTFGIYAYKNQQSGQNVRLSAHIADLVEMGNGAHYYAQGKLSSEYRSAEATVDLESIKLNLAGRRVACLALNFTSDLGGCDMCIENMGQGWFCFGYARNYKEVNSFSWVDSKPVCKGAVKCTIKITVTGSSSQTRPCNQIVGTFTWYNSSGAVITKDTLTCYSAGNPLFEMVNSGPNGRFTRFMSLILKDSIRKTPQNDYADGSSMIDGNFSNVKIFPVRGTSLPWTDSLFEYIWSVQGWNISECSVGGSTDKFSLTHSHNVYAK